MQSSTKNTNNDVANDLQLTIQKYSRQDLIDIFKNLASKSHDQLRKEYGGRGSCFKKTVTSQIPNFEEVANHYNLVPQWPEKGKRITTLIDGDTGKVLARTQVSGKKRGRKVRDPFKNKNITPDTIESSSEPSSNTPSNSNGYRVVKWAPFEFDSDLEEMNNRKNLQPKKKARMKITSKNTSESKSLKEQPSGQTHNHYSQTFFSQTAVSPPTPLMPLTPEQKIIQGEPKSVSNLTLLQTPAPKSNTQQGPMIDRPNFNFKTPNKRTISDSSSTSSKLFPPPKKNTNTTKLPEDADYFTSGMSLLGVHLKEK